MDAMTAEQALEAAKGLTFEKVWAAMMESKARMEEESKKMREEMRESQEQTAKQMSESHERMKEEMEKTHEKTAKLVADLSKNIGGVQNSIGRLTESMFTADLRSKFNALGYEFTQTAFRKEYAENDNVITEVDAILENGEYILLLEIKTELKHEFVAGHLERIEKVRKYMDDHNDTRKIIGAVAGGVVSKDVLRYAQKKRVVRYCALRRFFRNSRYAKGV
jgi:esterase/lipase